MAYSLDLRKRVVDFVSLGGSKAEASRRYEISLWCVNDWCGRQSLEAAKPPGAAPERWTGKRLRMILKKILISFYESAPKSLMSGRMLYGMPVAK